MASKLNLAALAFLPTTSFDGFVYRIVMEHMKDKILSTEGNRFYPGRYHLKGETGILYTSLEEALAMKELERHAARQQLQDNFVLGVLRIRLHHVLDLTKTHAWAKLKLSREDLVSPDYAIPQAISLQARSLMVQGLIVPSATGQGSNLIIFENNLGEGCLIEVESIRPQ